VYSCFKLRVLNCTNTVAAVGYKKETTGNDDLAIYAGKDGR